MVELLSDLPEPLPPFVLPIVATVPRLLLNVVDQIDLVGSGGDNAAATILQCNAAVLC